LRYKELTSFYGTVDRALALTETGETRVYASVHDALQEALRLNLLGPFTLVTAVQLLPDEVKPNGNRGEPKKPWVPFWEPPPPKPPPEQSTVAVTEERRKLQQDVYDALLAYGAQKGVALATAKALPFEITTFDDAFRWACRH
jgi:hypothetical protein